MNSLKQTSLNQLSLKAPRAIQLPCSLPREHFFKTCPRGFILRMLLQAKASLASPMSNIRRLPLNQTKVISIANITQQRPRKRSSTSLRDA
ncbi:MAG: hypothetical protein ACTS46_01585 [Candidatus Hodgkinia cicadicola]